MMPTIAHWRQILAAICLGAAAARTRQRFERVPIMSARISALMAACLCVFGHAAQADISHGLGGGGVDATFFTLSSAGLNSGTVATRSGGTVYTDGGNAAFAAKPAGVTVTSFLAAGPTSGSTAALSFLTPLTNVSFLWGSPDTYNVLSVITNLNSYSFNTTDFGLTGNGNQNVSAYVQFFTTAGETITGLSFTNNPNDNAFEVANFNTQSVPVPGPLVGAGLPGLMMACGGLLLLARRRRREAV